MLLACGLAGDWHGTVSITPDEGGARFGSSAPAPSPFRFLDNPPTRALNSGHAYRCAKKTAAVTTARIARMAMP